MRQRRVTTGVWGPNTSRENITPSPALRLLQNRFWATNRLFCSLWWKLELKIRSQKVLFISLRKHPFLLALRRWGRRGVPPRETSLAAKSEEKRMFSQANFLWAGYEWGTVKSLAATEYTGMYFNNHAFSAQYWPRSLLLFFFFFARVFMELDTKNSKKPRPYLARTSLTGKGFIICQITRFLVSCENKGGKIDPSHSSSSHCP